MTPPKTITQIQLEHGLCHCHEAYKSRDMDDPDNVAGERDELKLSIQKLGDYFEKEWYSGIAHRINGLLINK